MKKLNFSKNRFIPALLILIFVSMLANSCSKSDMPGPNEVFIQGNAFSPSTITVSAGTTITWTNKDGIDHTVTSTTGLFDSGSIGNGGTYSHMFGTTGTFGYKCTIHPSMTGTVLVN